MKSIYLLCFAVLSGVVFADEVTEIKILLPGDQSEAGLGIRSLPTLSIRDEKQQEFRISVINYFEDEIFLEILDLEGMDVAIRGDGLVVSGGHSSTFFPDNTNLLKRLHGRIKLNDGSFASCGCSMLSISGSAIIPVEFISDIDEGFLKKASITLPLNFTGYFRKTGKKFRGSVDLPLIIKEFEPGAVVNASQPAKTSENHLHD